LAWKIADADVSAVPALIVADVHVYCARWSIFIGGSVARRNGEGGVAKVQTEARFFDLSR